MRVKFNRLSGRYHAFFNFSCFSLLTLAVSSVAAQVGLTIPSNVEQTAAVTSRSAQVSRGSAGGPIALPEDFAHLRLASGFSLHMSIFNVPEMAQQLRIDNSGNVSIPLIGSIHIADDTLREAEQRIAVALREQEILTSPHVSLEITAYSQRPVLVAGEVQQPGKIQILAPRPVLDVIAMAGGVTTAAGGEIEIRHPQSAGPDLLKHISYANGRDPSEAHESLVSPGDTVYVRRAGVIYVLGAVNHPGGYLMVNGGTLTLTQAVALAGGASPIAAAATAVVVRPRGGGVNQIQVPLKQAERGGAPPYPLENGDMVFIPTSKVKAALVNSSAILSSAASAVIYTTVR